MATQYKSSYRIMSCIMSCQRRTYLSRFTIQATCHHSYPTAEPTWMSAKKPHPHPQDLWGREGRFICTAQNGPCALPLEKHSFKQGTLASHRTLKDKDLSLLVYCSIAFVTHNFFVALHLSHSKVQKSLKSVNK